VCKNQEYEPEGTLNQQACCVYELFPADLALPKRTQLVLIATFNWLTSWWWSIQYCSIMSQMLLLFFPPVHHVAIFIMFYLFVIYAVDVAPYK
jgi:hypothetical protein